MEQQIPSQFKSLIVGTLKQSYLCALNADKRSELEEHFIKWCDENANIKWD